MILICIIYLVSCASCLRITQNEKRTSLNVTKLYPVDNITYVRETNKQTDKLNKDNEKNKTELPNTVQGNKINDYFEIPNQLTVLDDEYENEIQNRDRIKKITQETEKKGIADLFSHTASWKVNATYSKSKLNLNDERNTSVNNSTNNESEKRKEFKPSPHLGNFFDEDTFVVPTQKAVGPFRPILTDPSLEFMSPPREFFKLGYQQPFTPYHTTINSPYKFENIVPRTKDWSLGSSQETKAPEEPKIPAGGLYQLPDPFKEKPGTDGDDDDFGLDFKDLKDTSVKKRGNPWRKILNLVTALIPVGIIVSALTPSIVTLESTDNNPRFPSRVSRRSEESVSALPVVSERCRRRLLCEMHADAHFTRNPSQRPNLCYKIICNDPQALNKLLHWLFQHNHLRARQHNLYDRRGFIT